jgi:hypothetical protein
MMDGPTIPNKCTAPKFMPAPTMAGFTGSVAVTISADPGNQVYYLTDGRVPSATTGTFYVAPVNIATTTTLIAVATGPNCTISDPTSGVYTINPPAPGTCASPQPNQGAGVYNNDFLLGLTVAPNMGCATPTICYTLDGSMPACSAGACTHGSTYSPSSQIAISGSVTAQSGANLGKVTVNALACQANATDGTLTGGAAYTLKVATPTLTPGPDPTVHLYVGSISPTIASQTAGVNALWANSLAGVSCSSGTPITGALPQQLMVDETKGTQGVFVVGCKPGYIGSDPGGGTYTITLNTPTITPPGGTAKPYDTNQTVTVGDTANADGTTKAYTCVSTSPATNPAACAANGACGAKNVLATTGPFTVNVDQTDIQAISCPGSIPFAPSGTADSKPYGLQLDAMQFSPANGTPIPTGGSLTVTVGQGTGTGHAYDFICSSIDGKTTPDCTCDTVKNPGLKQTLKAAFPLKITVSAPETIEAVGCLLSTSKDVYQPSDTPAATAIYGAATQMAAPTILPANGTINAPTPITFTNNEKAPGAENAYFCYTTDKSQPATKSAGVCYPKGALPAATGGSTTCTTGVTMPGANSDPKDATAFTVTQTGTTIRAIACDGGSTGKQASGEATAVLYTLVVGDPTISPTGAVTLGQAITFSSATPSAVFHWTDDGTTTPTCSTVLGAHSGTLTASGTAAANGTYQATYYAMGQETGKLQVTACAVGYSQAVNPASTTFTYAVSSPSLYVNGAALPLTGTYDDYVTYTPNTTGVAGSWFCFGSGAGCGSSFGLCTGSGTITEADGNCSTWTTDASGQPNKAPVCTAANQTISSNAMDSMVACMPSVPATGAIMASSPTNWNYTFQVSGLAMTQPSPATGVAAATSVSFGLSQTSALPDGNPAATPPTLSATHGGPTYICASSTATAVPAQPSDCKAFAALAAPAATPGNGWTCAQVVKATDLLTFADVGQNTTYQAFACKTFMHYSPLAGASVTFTPYVHNPFPLTGAASDFTVANEQITTAPAGTAYVTWDTGNLYVGFDKGSAYANGDVVHFYVGSPNVTAGATGPDGAGTAALPAGLNALYHVMWNFQSGVGSMDAWDAVNTKWAAGTAPTVKYNMSSTFVEIQVPLSNLAAAKGAFNLLGGLNTTASGANQAAVWPAWAGTSNKYGAVIANTTTVWNEFQVEYPSDAYAPNDTNQLNK